MKISFDSKKLRSKKYILPLVFSVVIPVGLLVILLRPPARSVSAFCSELQTQNNNLTKNGKTYNLGPVESSNDNMHDFATAYEKLDQVAPNDIEPSVNVLKKTAEKIDNDPTQSLSAGLSALGASDNVQSWVSSHCPSSAK